MDDAWENIAGWSPDSFMRQKDEWQRWKDNVRDHEHHTKAWSCEGCTREYCEHMTHLLCSDFPACCFCDEWMQPNPFNPINRRHVEVYLDREKRELIKELTKDDREVDGSPFYLMKNLLSTSWSQDQETCKKRGRESLEPQSGGFEIAKKVGRR